jgi:hypothetical protein
MMKRMSHSLIAIVATNLVLIVYAFSKMEAIMHTLNVGICAHNFFLKYILISKNEGLPFRKLNVRATSLKLNFVLPSLTFINL